ncbi:MAG: hypothetical protein JXO72_03395 [Vicinamibacteria bacterium]|nr:hypothetical protein [Vicinamibacteria bacterium]
MRRICESGGAEWRLGERENLEIRVERFVFSPTRTTLKTVTALSRLRGWCRLDVAEYIRRLRAD